MGVQFIFFMVEAQSNSSSSPVRTPGSVCLKLVTQNASRLRFRRFIYGWKANLIRKPIQVVSHQKTLESTRIIETSQRPEFTRVLRHRLLVRWAVCRVWAH